MTLGRGPKPIANCHLSPGSTCLSLRNPYFILFCHRDADVAVQNGAKGPDGTEIGPPGASSWLRAVPWGTRENLKWVTRIPRYPSTTNRTC